VADGAALAASIEPLGSLANAAGSGPCRPIDIAVAMPIEQSQNGAPRDPAH
jgi:hypothetical protein